MPVRLPILLLLLGVGPLTAQEWSTFSSAKGNFRVVFPAPPEEAVQSIQTTVGPIPYTTYTSEIAGGNVAFGIAYNDYPEEILAAQAEKILDVGRDGVRDNLSGAVVSETYMTFKGHPAREFTVLGEVQGKKLLYHARMYLIGTRLYQMQVVRVGDTPVDIADMIRFFASFEQIQP